MTCYTDCMERLSGLDAGFLHQESPTVPMHTLKIAVLDPSTVPGGYSFDRFRDEFGMRLHLLPPFRKRLVEVPLGVHDPMWADDPDFDLDRHIRRQVAPAPGGRREIDDVIADIASHPLPRDRPLWETTVIEGLEGGRLAFVTKVHHAVADGVAAAELLANVTSLTPDTSIPEGAAALEDWKGEPLPGRYALFRIGLIERLRMLLHFPRLLVRTLRNLVAVARRRRGPGVNAPRPILDAPITPFNRSLTADRAFATVSLDFERLRAVKARLDVTVNDVLLAMVTGALRSYLQQRGELPDVPLVAGVPVSTDKPEDVRRLGGNKVSNLFTGLPTEEADPLKRVRRIHEVTKEAKVVQNLLGADMLAAWSDFTGRPYGWVMRQYSRSRVADRGRPMINLVVSNVPGPREHLYVAGARIDEIYSVGPILESVGLNVTAWSYGDRLNVSMLACPDHIPDLRRITAGLEPALAELEAAAPGSA
jgi:diacylglycerol O-acyltransferase